MHIGVAAIFDLGFHVARGRPQITTAASEKSPDKPIL
jgi:hypothetical protein